MNPLRIHRKNLNLEIVAKIIDSVARKFGCRVDYNPVCQAVTFAGDDAFKRRIIDETAALFGSGAGHLFAQP